jgi:arylsulfatase A-like enzyme
LTDVLPTTLDLTGASAGEALDGRSLVPVLQGSAGSGSAGVDDALGRAFAFSEIGFPNRPRYMVRTDRWKYNHYTNPAACELFDLSEDPLERHNLADDLSVAATLNHLRTQLLDWLPAELPR